jgi:glycosyltransferase involved in cell wall biosynthesis
MSNTIVHIGPSNLVMPARRGGAIERRMIELARAQARFTGRQIVVYSIGEKTCELSFEGLQIRYIHVMQNRFGRRFTFPWIVAEDVKRYEPSIIHLHSRAELIWLLRQHGINVPIVLSCDNHLEPLARFRLIAPLTRSLWSTFLHTDGIVCPVSEYCREMWESYWRIPAARLQVIPNGVDLEHFSPRPAERYLWRERLGLGDKVVVLYVGRICEQKGSDLLIGAYRRLRERRADVALLVVGPARQFGNLEGDPLIEDLRAAGGIYLPPVTDEELPGVYSTADILVMPTRELEMFGMAAVEAQACGIPVLASDHGGLKETVPTTAGLRFRSGDVADLEGKLELMVVDPELRAALSRGALQSAARYSWTEVVEQCERLYSRLRGVGDSETRVDLGVRAQSRSEGA